MKLQVDYTHLHGEDATTGLDAGQRPRSIACAPPFSWDSDEFL